MPLYEYQCEACAHRFEVIQKFSDAPIATCQKCGGPVRKLPSSPAIQFKGSGWYITDYARAGKSDNASSGGKSDGKSDGATSSGDSKTEAKTEAKSETKSDTKTESKPKPATPSTSS
jgi:putative FmdB family regulatory protein